MAWSQDRMPSNNFHVKLSEACLEVFHSGTGARGGPRKFEMAPGGVNTVINNS